MIIGTGVALEVVWIGSVADTAALYAAILIFLYAMLAMRRNLKRLETASVNEWFIFVHLVNFIGYTLIWTAFLGFYYAGIWT